MIVRKKVKGAQELELGRNQAEVWVIVSCWFRREEVG